MSDSDRGTAEPNEIDSEPSDLGQGESLHGEVAAAHSESGLTDAEREREALREELRKEVREELEQEAREEHRKKVKEELRAEVEEEVEEELREEGKAESEKENKTADEDEDDASLFPGRKIWLAAIGLLIVYLLANFIDVWLASGSEHEEPAQAIVVLGAAQYNGQPSAALQGRLDRAGELYIEERAELVVVTGGGQPADETTEAKTGYDYLRDTASIPDENLRLEVDGTSTYQSLAAVARFLAEEQIDDVILVTDPYHAKRSKLIAEEVGLNAEVVPTETSPTLDRMLREAAAISVGRILGFRRIDAYLTGSLG